jgi:hypothetical protein
MLIEIVRGAGVDEEKLDSLRRKFVGVDLEVVRLTLAVGALISGIATQNDQNNPAFRCQIGELDCGPFGSRQGEVRGFASDVRNLCHGEEGNDHERE